MIQALDRNKVKLNKNYDEDSKVASILGVLKNLPCELFWEIMRKSCADNIMLPHRSGEILNIEFWPNGWKYVNRVEPDIYIEFENFDLIIEAKINDDKGQLKEQEQWRKEVIAYLLNKELQISKKLLYVIALGGNGEMRTESIAITYEDLCDIDNTIESDFEFTTQVFKSNWFSILIVISDIKKQFTRQEYFQSFTKPTLRIIEDAITGFNLHNLYAVEWFDSLEVEVGFEQKEINKIINWNYA